MYQTFVEIVLLLLMGFFGTVMLYSIIEDDIVRYVIGFLYWVLIVLGVCYCIKVGNDTDKLNASIKTTLESYYSGSTDYKDQTFVYDGKKYNYDYNTETKTLTVFDGTGTIVNSIQIDGVYKLSQDQCKDPNTNGNEVSSETTSESAATDTSKKSMNSDSTAVSENQEGLAKRIQDKIQERYTNAVITSFDTTNLTGTFESDTGNYGFSWSDNMLEIFNLENKDQNIYYKVPVSYEVD